MPFWSSASLCSVQRPRWFPPTQRLPRRAEFSCWLCWLGTNGVRQPRPFRFSAWSASASSSSASDIFPLSWLLVCLVTGGSCAVYLGLGEQRRGLGGDLSMRASAYFL